MSQLVSPGAATDCIAPIFPEKKLTTFLVIAVYKVMTFLAVVSSQLSPSDLVYPVFFLDSATFLLLHSGVTPPEGCHPGRSAPLFPLVTSLC